MDIYIWMLIINQIQTNQPSFQMRQSKKQTQNNQFFPMLPSKIEDNPNTNGTHMAPRKSKSISFLKIKSQPHSNDSEETQQKCNKLKKNASQSKLKVNQSSMQKDKNKNTKSQNKKMQKIQHDKKLKNQNKQLTTYYLDKLRKIPVQINSQSESISHSRDTFKNNKSRHLQQQGNYDYLRNIRQVRKTVGWSELDRVKYQLSFQRNLREELQRQVESLKKQISFLNNFSISMRSSMNPSSAFQKKTEESQTKDKILSRLNQKRQAVPTYTQNTKEGEGLNSAKTGISEGQESVIKTIYEDFINKNKIPTVQIFCNIFKGFFKSTIDSIEKLNSIFIQIKQRNKDTIEMLKNEQWCEIKDQLFLLNIPTVYQQRTKQKVQIRTKLFKQRQMSVNAIK